MSVITVLVPDDQAPNQDKEREYDVAFALLGVLGASGRRAKFHVFQVWDETGRHVEGAERGLVVKHALECYHAEMVAAVRRR